jgi:RNA polymerase sigma-70 factor (ECF subfamily)
MEISMDHTVETGDDEQPAMEVPDRTPSVEQQLVARTRSEMILRAIHALPEKQRAAVLLHKYQELDYDEIARILECSESALKSLLFRAYETLRVELAPLVNSARV